MHDKAALAQALNDLSGRVPPNFLATIQFYAQQRQSRLEALEGAIKAGRYLDPCEIEERLHGHAYALPDRARNPLALLTHPQYRLQPVLFYRGKAVSRAEADWKAAGLEAEAVAGVDAVFDAVTRSMGGSGCYGLSGQCVANSLLAAVMEPQELVSLLEREAALLGVADGCTIH